MEKPKYKLIVIGVDQSYTRTGISVVSEGREVHLLCSLDFKGCKNKTEKRMLLADKLESIYQKIEGKADHTVLICERIRLRSNGFLSASYIKATGALLGILIDISYKHGVKVFSVDTRAWKSAIVGSSKGDGSDDKLANKLPTLKYLVGLGFKAQITYRDLKGKLQWNDDKADALCIGFYGLLPKAKRKLLKEE